MKRRILFLTQIVLFGLFGFSLLAVVFQLSGDLNPLTRFNYSKPVYNHVEAYNPSLSGLNSLEKIEHYCDSIYTEKANAGKPVEYERTYTDIVSFVIRNRFYHGYSSYGFGDNYLAMLTSKTISFGLGALVIPDEILKYPYAACSQQSIVMMEVLKDKGFATRKILFQGKTFGGHFAFEVFYDGAWHFVDPNMEPDIQVLDSYGRPGIDFLVRNPEILVKAYNQFPQEKILDILPNYTYGPVNKFPAPRAIIFQKATFFLSYTIWIFFLVAWLFARRMYSRASNKMSVKKNRVTDRHEQPGAASIYYPDYSAQGT